MPIIEEAADRGRRVDRHELVDRAGRKPLLGDLGGCDGARRQKHGGADTDQAVDEGHGRDCLADARRMHPDERAGRALATSDAEALAAPGAVLLAVALAQAKRRIDQWRREPASGAVEGQCSLAEESAGVPAVRDLSLRQGRAAALRQGAVS